MSSRRSERIGTSDAGLSTVCLLIFTLANACSSPPEPAAPTPVDTAWTEDLLAERAEKDESFRTSRTSPMAGIQYLKSEPAEEVYLSREGDTFTLTHTPTDASIVHLVQVGGTWQWFGEGVGCEVEGEAVASGALLEGAATFAVGGFDLSFYPSEDRVTFIVFDPERAEKLAFERLEYYPPDPAYAVAALLVPFPEPEKVEMPTSRGLVKTFYRFAHIRFEIDGEPHELTALKSELEGEGSDYLFIPFKDATTGRETYGAGRYLELEEPADSDFVLDFNRAFNPLCNYSPAYNCTLPPHENRLAAAILAGEKTYPH